MLKDNSGVFNLENGLPQFTALQAGDSGYQKEA